MASNATLFETSIFWTFPTYVFTNVNGTELLFTRLLNVSNETIGSGFDIVDDDSAFTLRYGVLGSVLLR